MDQANDSVEDSFLYNTNDEKVSLTPYSDAVKCQKTVKHVKRPMNPFMIWSQMERRKIIIQNPNIHNAEISVQLGKRWKALSNEERIPFAVEAERLRQLHSQEFPNYKFSPKPRKKRTPKLQPNFSSLQKFSPKKTCGTSENSDCKKEKFIAQNNLTALKTRRAKKSETLRKIAPKLVSKSTGSVSSPNVGKISKSQVEKSLKTKQAQSFRTSQKRLEKASDYFSVEEKKVWDSLMDVDITSITTTSNMSLLPRLYIDKCLTSGAIAALSRYREDPIAAFDYLTDKVLQSSKNIYEEIQTISKQYGDALKGDSDKYPSEPSELNIPDINKVLGINWKDPNFGLMFTSKVDNKVLSDV